MTRRHGTTPYDHDGSISAELHELARAHRILEMEGHGDMSMGHLSLRDPFDRGLWLKRGNLGLEEVRGDDFILIDFDGRVLEGQGLRHLEWPLHAEIMRARDDVGVVGHSHPPHAVALGATTAEFSITNNHGTWFAREGVPRFAETSHIITTPDLGRAAARTLGAADGMLLANHGIAFVGASVRDATLAGVFLEWAARHQLAVASSGLTPIVPAAEESVEKDERIHPDRARNNFWTYFNRKLHRLEHGATDEGTSA